jgi:predicted RNA methylase
MARFRGLLLTISMLLLSAAAATRSSSSSTEAGSCREEEAAQGGDIMPQVSLVGSLEHWAHPLLRRPLFDHLADAAKNAAYASALRRQLVQTATAKLEAGAGSGRRRKRRIEISLLEYGSGAWSVSATQILSTVVQPRLAAANAILKFSAVIVAQEDCFATIARATVARHGEAKRIQVVRSLMAPGSSSLQGLRGAGGQAVDLATLPKLDIVVCDGFGRPDTRLLEHAALLHALHRARRLPKPVVVLPSAVQFHAMAVHSEALRRRSHVGVASGLDMSVFDAYTRATAARSLELSGARDLAAVPPLKLSGDADEHGAHQQQPAQAEGWMALSDAFKLGLPVSLTTASEFYTLALSQLHRAVDGEGLRVTATGRLDGVVVWAEEWLGDEPVPGTGPLQLPIHRQWGPTAYLWPPSSPSTNRSGGGEVGAPPVVLTRGDTLAVELFADADTGISVRPPGAEGTNGGANRSKQWNAEFYTEMLNDDVRNSAYERAISNTVELVAVKHAHRASDESVRVLDIGSGGGLLSLLALKAGRNSSAVVDVTALEVNRAIASVSRSIIKANTASDENASAGSITVLATHSRALASAEDAAAAAATDAARWPTRNYDLLVSEIVDVTLIGEGVLDTVCHAVTHLLRDNSGTDANDAPLMIPRAATLWVTAVSSPALRLGAVTLNSTLGDSADRVDLSSWDSVLLSDQGGLTHVPFDFNKEAQARATGGGVWRLSEPTRLGQLMLTRCVNRSEVEWVVDIDLTKRQRHDRVDASGDHADPVDAILFHFDMMLDDNEIISTDPAKAAPSEHWGQAAFVLPPSIRLQAIGSPLRIRLWVESAPGQRAEGGLLGSSLRAEVLL